MKDKRFREIRVVSKNAVSDWFQGIRNFLGMRLKGYERKLIMELDEMFEVIDSKGKVNWYKLDVEEISYEGMIIIIYGEYK